MVRAACLPVSSHDALCLPRSQYLLCESPTPVHRMNMLYTWSLGLAMSVCLSGGEVSDSIQGQQGPDMENLWSQTSEVVSSSSGLVLASVCRLRQPAGDAVGL